MHTQQSIEPLKDHLVDLEKAVQEQLDMWVVICLISSSVIVSPMLYLYNFRISTVKSNILKNDEKISRMVGSIGIAGK